MNASRKSAIREIMRLNSVSYATAKRMVDSALRLIGTALKNGLSEDEISGLMKAKNGSGKAIHN